MTENAKTLSLKNARKPLLGRPRSGSPLFAEKNDMTANDFYVRCSGGITIECLVHVGFLSNSVAVFFR